MYVFCPNSNSLTGCLLRICVVSEYLKKISRGILQHAFVFSFAGSYKVVTKNC